MAAGADRCANCHLTGARSAADKQQVGDVDADNQQHERCQPEQQRQRLCGDFRNRALSARASFESDPFL